MVINTSFVENRQENGIKFTATTEQALNVVNCTNSKAVYHYVRRHKPDRLEDLFTNLPEPYDSISNIEAYLTDENNWVSSELITKLFDNAAEIFQDPGVAFNIGMETITTKTIGTLQSFFLTTFATPKSVIKRLNQINQQFNTTKIIETVYISSKRTVVRLHWKENSKLSKNICLYNQGVYAAIPTLWGQPPQTVIETECYFNGAPYCQYNVTFNKKNIFKFSFRHQLKSRKSRLLLALEEIENDKLLLKKKNDEVIKLNLELKEKVERLKAINEASRLLVSMVDADEILKTTMNIIVDVLKFDRALLMLIDNNNEYLEYIHSTGAKKEEVDLKLKNYRIPLSRKENILIRTTLEGKPVLIKNAVRAGLNPNNFIIREFSPNSIAFCPLITSKGAIGILAADRMVSDKLITRKELEHLSIFVNNMAVTLHKVRQDEEIERSYINTVKALVKAIEEKDPYTKGHSERVSLLATRIATAMDLSKEEVEFINIGSLLHDVGKIGIPESIVRSPKKLSAAEYNIIKSHPEKGAEIVSPIRRFKDHVYLIKYHHEHFDGTGYPAGLKGHEIPVGAQIVSIADTYDAITSSRAYRKGLPMQEAALRIAQARGRQFSPEVTDAFLRVYETEILSGRLKLG